MRSVIVGSGWIPGLLVAEVNSLLHNEQASITSASQRLLIIDAEIDLAALLSVSATTDDLYSPAGLIQCQAESPIQELRLAFSNWLNETGLDPSTGPVAIRAQRHGEKEMGWSPTALAGQLGGVLTGAGWGIDLTDPALEIGLTIDAQAKTLAWGVKHFPSPPRSGWVERTPSQRPFFKPVSMDPRHACLMLNLVKGEGAVLDPMTGTGGLVIEAAFLGRHSIGVDIDSEMLTGAGANAQWAMQEGASGMVALVNGDATDLVTALEEITDVEITGVVFDPPYGRNSQGSVSPSVLFSGVLDSARQVVEEGARLACMLPCDPNDSNQVYGRRWDEIESDFIATGWKVMGRWEIPVHSSMGRLMILVQTA